MLVGSKHSCTAAATLEKGRIYELRDELSVRFLYMNEWLKVKYTLKVDNATKWLTHSWESYTSKAVRLETTCFSV